MESKENCFWKEKLQHLGVVVLVPTYNNAKTLSAVIEEVKLYSKEIIVINDGSTDNTAQILSGFTEINVITHTKNAGKVRALNDGLCMAKKMGFRYAITIDSDGQHFASDIPAFIIEIEQTPDSLIVGARNLTSDNMPGKNTFANKFSNFWFTLETGLKLTDTQSGYRLYPLHKLGSMKFYTAKYEFELEAIVFAAWNDVCVKNIPVHVYYPPAEERVSHFRPFWDFFRISILNTILVLITFLWIVPKRFCKKLSINNINRFLKECIFNSKASNSKITQAVMLGIFMGIIPVWGYQMLLTLFLSSLLKLNKTISIIAANISLPPVIPFLLYGSYYIGCKAMNRVPDLNFSNVSLENMKNVLEQYVVGSIILAFLCSLVVGTVTFSLLSIFRKKTI